MQTAASRAHGPLDEQSGPLDGRPTPPTTRAVRLLRVLRWALPLVLCLIGIYAEFSEHIAAEHEEVSIYLLSEVLLFSVAGPVAVFFTLSWVVRMVGAYQLTADALQAANRGLEAAVVERTRHLQEATDQLATANADLARANTDLRQLDRMKSAFVSLVSHQLRAPLTNIVGALELVSADAAALPPSSQRTLQILTLESQRLSRLIQRILDVSRLDAGRLPVNLGPVAVEPLLARAAESTLGVAGESAPWTMSIPGELPPAWADEELLGEVVRNLLDNAVRYAPADRPVVIDAQVHLGNLEIGVSDEGPGVPVEEQSRIFESFHRIGDADTSVAGHGLGLYFAERLIRAQHGAIGVQSPLRPGADAPGSRFWVRVPIAAGAPDEDDVPLLPDDPAPPDRSAASPGGAD
jgi:signal transduction histidine kinase